MWRVGNDAQCIAWVADLMEGNLLRQERKHVLRMGRIANSISDVSVLRRLWTSKQGYRVAGWICWNGAMQGCVP